MRFDAILRSAARQAPLVLLAALFVVPLAWVIAASLRTPGLPPPRTIEWIPDPIAWSNYGRIFDLAPLARYALNSLFVAALAVPITIVTASWAGFALTQLPADERVALLRLAVVLLMVPFTAVWLGRFLLFKQLSLIDSVWALVAPALMGTSPFFVLLFYWAYHRLPRELYEAARLDGAGAFAIWRTVAFPLSLPVAAGVAVMTFVLYWSDYVNPLLYLKSPDLYTLPVGVQLLQQMDRTQFPLLMAGVVVMVAPLLVMFGLLSRVLRHVMRAEPGSR